MAVFLGAGRVTVAGGGGICGDRRHHAAKDSNEFRTAAGVRWPRWVHGGRRRIQAGKHGRPRRRAATEVTGVHLPAASPHSCTAPLKRFFQNTCNFRRLLVHWFGTYVPPLVQGGRFGEAGAAELLNCHPNTLRNWDNIGKLKAIHFGGRGDRYYKKADILKLIK